MKILPGMHALLLIIRHYHFFTRETREPQIAPSHVTMRNVAQMLTINDANGNKKTV